MWRIAATTLCWVGDAPPPPLPGARRSTTSPRSDASLRRFLHGLPGVDQVGAEARAAALGTRSIKTTAKAYAIDLAIRMVDLTTLEGADTPGKVRALAPRRCAPTRPTRPARRSPRSASTPTWSPTAKRGARRLAACNVASVATAFPSGRAALDIKLADTRDAVAAGADEIDMVIDRGAFLSGRYLQVFDEIVAVKEAVRHDAHLKVILETGELQTYDNVRRASLAGDAGRRRLHQDLHRQGPAGRDAAGHAGDARGGPRLPRARPAGRSA